MSYAAGEKVAIVTGATGGIGRAIVQAYIEQDYFVYGLDMQSVSDSVQHPNYAHHPIDITNFKELEQFFDAVEYKSHNVLVNCAGTREICPIKSLTLDIWNNVFAINVTAPFVASRAFSEKVIASGSCGAIVNIASVSGLMGEPERTAYVSSKHALIGLTKQLAIEYGRAGIRVNAIAPGVIRTPLTEQYYSNPVQMQKINSGQFIDHQGMPADVAAAALFLVSDQARFMTGSTMVLDGGWTAGKNI
jgi:NAD(P)-dependent dehydrogenase (short-subunit alcohol dehydrogenase family)